MFKICEKHVLIGDLLSFSYHGKYRSGVLTEHVENDNGNTITCEMTLEDREQYEDNIHTPMLNSIRKIKPCYRSFRVVDIQHLHVA